MKRTRKTKIFLSIAAVVAVIACVCVFTPQKNAEEPPAVIEVGKNTDYIDIDVTCHSVEEWFEHSDLVVRGKSAGPVDVFPLIADGMPIQFQKLKVDKVYKGDCGDELTYIIPGGEVHLREFVESAAKNGISGDIVLSPLRNIDSFKEMYPDLNVVYRCREDFAFVPEENQEYLMFLGWVPLSNVSGAYMPYDAMHGRESTTASIRKINEDGLVLNPYTQNYETIFFMEEHETE